MMKYKHYSKDDLNDATEKYKAGVKMKVILIMYPNIPESTIRDR